ARAAGPLPADPRPGAAGPDAQLRDVGRDGAGHGRHGPREGRRAGQRRPAHAGVELADVVPAVGHRGARPGRGGCAMTTSTNTRDGDLRATGTEIVTIDQATGQVLARHPVADAAEVARTVTTA